MINLLSLGRVTSEYGKRNTGIKGASTNHKGIDIVLRDKKIPAVLGGKVIENSYNSARGWFIKIKAEDGTTHLYQHMANKSVYGIGTSVKEGANIGTMGNTGVGSGAHLHFEVFGKNGTNMNPRSYLTGATGSPDYSEGGTSSADSGNGLQWWGDIVKVVICGLLVIGGVAMFVLGIKDTVLE